MSESLHFVRFLCWVETAKWMEVVFEILDVLGQGHPVLKWVYDSTPLFGFSSQHILDDQQLWTLFMPLDPHYLIAV